MAKLTNGLSFNVPFETAPKEKLQVQSYLFDTDGNLVEQQPLVNGTVTFKTPADKAQGLRMLIAAPLPDDNQAPVTYDSVLKRNAFEPQLPADLKAKATLIPIPERLQNLWFWKRCLVTGKVVKMFDIDRNPVEKPVCRARVHICEVDKIKLVLPKLPDWVFQKLRDVIINPPVLKPRFPVIPVPPEPPVITQIPKIDPAVISTRVTLPVSGIKNPAIAPSKTVLTAKDRIVKQVLPVAQVAQTSPLVSDAIRAQLISPSLDVVKTGILSNIDVLHPYFCTLPWLWPYFYPCTELAVAYTDANGNFSSTILYNLDVPDIYFWIEYEINGVWSTVYKPSIPCHTIWNYVCGTPVKLTVKDPRIPMCGGPVLPGEIAWVRTIGNGASVVHIEQNLAAADVIQGQNFRTVGLTDFGRPLSQYRRPFAKSLQFYVQFGSGFPSAGVTHYRWSYRKIKDAYLNDVAEGWNKVNGTISKPYTIEYTDITGTHFKTQYFDLGPVVGLSDTAFRIPPASAVTASGDATAQWNQNTMTMEINTSDIDDGLYEFKLELLKVTGATVTVVNVPKNTFQTPLFNDSTASENAPDALLGGISGPNAAAFVVKVRIDNEPTQADIYNIKVYNADASVNESTTECGFVKYKDKATSQVEFRFKAFHPRDFAEFSFDVARGNSGDPLSDADGNGMVIGNTAGGYILGGDDIFRKKVAVSYLLKTCDKAAFAESLYVDALATNGSVMIDEYDSSDLAAFALEF